MSPQSFSHVGQDGLKNGLKPLRTEPRWRRCALCIAGPLLLAGALLLAGGTAVAVEVPTLYTVQVPLAPNDPNARSNAYDMALSQIVARITGTREALAPGELDTLFPDAARYVLQFRPGEDDTLWVTLDGATIERVLMSAGHSVWGSERPLTLVWLAVDWGGGEREIIAAGDAQRSDAEARSIDRNRLLRERVEEVAEARGIPVAFPLMDIEDLESVAFTDVWGGFDEQLLAASGRYGASSILVGRIRPGPGQRNRWSYYFGGEQREWGGEPEEVVHRLADTLGGQFALSPNEQLASIPITVSGIDSVLAYGTVHAWLESLALVRELSVDTVSGDSIRFIVKAHGDRERLRRALESARHLEPVGGIAASIPGGGPGGASAVADGLAFRYRP
jgi:hypothetical protein